VYAYRLTILSASSQKERVIYGHVNLLR